MTDIEQHLKTLTDTIFDAEKLYQSPCPDWDMFGPDAESPQLVGAANAIGALRGFVRAVLPDAPRDLLAEIHGAIHDVATGRSSKLFERPRKTGAPSMPIRDECAMVLLAVIVTFLIRGGWKKALALSQVSRAASVEARTIDRYRKNLRNRPSYAIDLYTSILRRLFECEASEYIRECEAASFTADLQDPEVIRMINEHAGLISCEMVAASKQFRPAPRPARRERAGSSRRRAMASGPNGTGRRDRPIKKSR